MARLGAGTLLIKAVSAFLGLAVAVLLARELGPEGYGLYAYVFSLVSLMAVPAQLGLSTLVVRETARADVNKHWELMLGVWRWAGGAVAVLSLGVATVGLLGAWLLKDHFTDLELSTFLWGVMLIPVIALGNIRGAALRGLRRVLLGQLPELVLRPMTFVFLLYCVVALDLEDLSASLAMTLHVAAATFAFVVGAVMLKRAKPKELSTTKAAAYDSGSWFSSLWPLGLLAGMQVINKYTDLLMLGAFATAEDVGIYRAAIQAAILVAFGLHIANMVVAPHITRLYAQQDRVALQRIVTATSRAMLLVALPVAGIFVLSGTFLLGAVFGAEYASGGVALSILVLGRLGASLLGPVALVLNMSGYEHQTARAVAAAALGNVVLNICLIPRYGMNGAAIATSITMVTWHVVLWRVALKSTGIDTSPLPIIRGCQWAASLRDGGRRKV